MSANTISIEDLSKNLCNKKATEGEIIDILNLIEVKSSFIKTQNIPLLHTLYKAVKDVYIRYKNQNKIVADKATNIGKWIKEQNQLNKGSSPLTKLKENSLMRKNENKEKKKGTSGKKKKKDQLNAKPNEKGLVKNMEIHQKEVSVPAANSKPSFCDSTKNSERDKALEIIHKYLESDQFKDENQRKNLAIELEKELYSSFFEKNITKYRDQLRTIISNMKNIRNELFGGKITCKQLASMDPRDMATEEQKEERKNAERQAFESRISNWDQQNLIKSGYKSIYKCNKCGDDKVTYYQMQTLYADEPMTIFYRCQVCGAEWKSY